MYVYVCVYYLQPWWSTGTGIVSTEVHRSDVRSVCAVGGEKRYRRQKERKRFPDRVYNHIICTH